MFSFSQLLALTTPEHLIHVAENGLGVYESAGTRWICTPDGTVQSAMSLGNPTAVLLPNHQAMLLAALLPPRLHAVLDMGLGGGTLTRQLTAHWPRARRVALEHDPHMLALAREYFALPTTQPVLVEDAIDFLKRNKDRFNLLFVDLFDGSRSPPALRSQKFYGQLLGTLEAGGAVALNSLPSCEREMREILQAARQVFNGIGIMQFSELRNVVLILQEEPLPKAQELQRLLDASVYANSATLYANADSMLRLERAPNIG